MSLESVPRSLFENVKSWTSGPTQIPHHLSIEVTPTIALFLRCVSLLVVLCGVLALSVHASHN